MNLKNGLDRGIQTGKIAAGLRCRHNSLYTRPVNPDRLRADPFEAFSRYSPLIARTFFPCNAKRPPLGGREDKKLGHYRTELLTFRGLPHDPQCVLTAVYQFALMSVKLCLNIISGRREAGLELGVAVFAYADGRRRASFYDPQASLLHDASLAHSEQIGWPVEIKRHHYRTVEGIDFRHQG